MRFDAVISGVSLDHEEVIPPSIMRNIEIYLTALTMEGLSEERRAMSEPGDPERVQVCDDSAWPRALVYLLVYLSSDVPQSRRGQS